MVEVVQADRDAAEKFRRGYGGKYDRDVANMAAVIAQRVADALSPQSPPQDGRAAAFEEAAAMIESWGTNNVGMLEPVAREQAARLRTLAATPPQDGDEVERVARALCGVAQANARAKFGDDKIAATYGWQDWLPDARAAISALRSGRG